MPPRGIESPLNKKQPLKRPVPFFTKYVGLLFIGKGKNHIL